MILLLGTDNIMCTEQEQRALIHNPKVRKCLNVKCMGVPYLPCLGKCVHKLMDGKVTPMCLGCYDSVVSCGTTKCEDCMASGGISSAEDCGMCLDQRCTKEVFVCLFSSLIEQSVKYKS